jgi:hypothetical protein
MLTFKNEFEENCQKVFETDSKIGLFCSIAPDGYPHIALISSIGIKDNKTLMWGQFSRGLSKDYLKDNQKTGFIVVSPDQTWWTGKSLHTGSAVSGEDFDYFNNKPLFRYNSYCGFGAIHYGKLVDVSIGEKLPLLKIAQGFFASGFLKKPPVSHNQDSIEKVEKLPSYGMNLASSLTCLKFVAFVDTDGFPRLFPVMQGRPFDANTLRFSSIPYSRLLQQIPQGAKTAVFLANLDLESLLLQGRWFNTEKNNHLKNSFFEIDKVYNSMLPVSGYIYPPRTMPNVYGKMVLG